MKEKTYPGQGCNPAGTRDKPESEGRQASYFKTTLREFFSQLKPFLSLNKRQGLDSSWRSTKALLGWLMFYIITAICTARQILRLIGVVI